MSDASTAPITQPPRLRPVPPGATPVATLPNFSAPLIGRSRDIDQLLDLLGHQIRLLTLTGVGGIGKTRLAVEVAARARERYADGAAFVTLAAIREPGDVAPAIAISLDLRETTDSTLERRLTSALVDRELLLVIDNFEHVLDAAPVIAELLAACPRLTIVVTSRAPLRLAEEREVPVPPLALPGPNDPPHADKVKPIAAVRLFVERARALVPGFALTTSNADAVAAICLRLDGLPLAIELAAGRTRVLEPAALLARLERRLPLLTGNLRDAPARQRTMRDAITWSYDLLREHEQVLFRRLSVFAGGCTLATAEATIFELSRVHPERQDPADAAPEVPLIMLEVLETLLDHHLIEREEQANGDVRFTMLETIREYALDRLEASGEVGAVRSAHAAAITTWAERAKPRMFEADQARWLARGAAEQPNVRTALTWALERGDAATAHRLAAANGPVWLKHSLLREAQGWLERVLAVPGPAPVEAVTVCRFIASSVAVSLGLTDRCLEHSRAGMALAREAGDAFGEGLALMVQSGVLLDRDPDAAEEANEAALICLWALPNRPRVASCFVQRAEIANARGDHVRFAELAKEAHAYAVDVEDPWSVAVALVVRAEAAHLNGASTQALTHLAEGMTIAHRIEVPDIVAWAVRIAGVVAHAHGDHRLALRWTAAGRIADASHGVSPQRRHAEWARTIIADARKSLGRKAAGIEEAAGEAVAIADAADEVRNYRPGSRRSPALSPLGVARLTAREEEVLRLIASGLTDRQIADALFIARPTVSKHVGSVLSKLGAASRAAVVDTAHRLGLIDGGEPPRLDPPSPHT